MRLVVRSDIIMQGDKVAQMAKCLGALKNQVALAVWRAFLKEPRAGAPVFGGNKLLAFYKICFIMGESGE